MKFGDMHGGLPQIGLENNPSLVDYHTTYIVEEFCNTVYFCFEKSTSSTVCRLVIHRLRLTSNGTHINKPCL